MSYDTVKQQLWDQVCMSCPTAGHFLKLVWDVDGFGAHVFNINALI